MEEQIKRARKESPRYCCASCHEIKPVRTVTLSWSPETHWMYEKNLKSIALFLLWVGKQQKNLHPILDKHIWLIIMRYILIPHEWSSSQNPYGFYCDECTKRLYL